MGFIAAEPESAAVTGGTLVSGSTLGSVPIPVPPLGFPGETFAMVTDKSFTNAGTITASFTWAGSLSNTSSGSSSSGTAASSSFTTASDFAGVYPVLLQVNDVLAYSSTGSDYQSTGGLLDVKTQITSGVNGQPARVRLKVTGPPPGVLTTLSLSMGTVNFNSDPGNPMHQARVASGSSVSTAASGLAFSVTYLLVNRPNIVVLHHYRRRRFLE